MTIVKPGRPMRDLQYPIRGSARPSCNFRWRVIVLVWVAIIVVPIARITRADEVAVLIRDDALNHVHTAGYPITINLKIDHSGPGVVSFHWQNFRDQRLSESEPLKPGKMTTITAPPGITGYLGLVLTPATLDPVMPDRLPGETREYGFALLPPPATAVRQVDALSRFGMVHADLEDRYLTGWVKTMTWKTTGPKWWGMEMEKRRSLGLLELPIVVGAEWKSSDMQPVSATQLEQLKSRVEKYFAAHPDTLYWEAGIEENLRHRYQTPYYWYNLSAKIRVVREAANAVDPDIKLIYQIAELRPEDVRAFLNSPAAPYYDILSLHPYAWPDFPDPESWLGQYISDINGLLENKGSNMPLWFSEVGVPHRGNHANGFFGYPGKGVEVPGKSRYQAVIYLLKLHVIAYHLGVEKIFWYNYKDRKPEREYAENHFGLRDYWGYPKPVYPAYVNLQKQLRTKRTGRAWGLPGDIRAYEFIGQDERVIVAWTYPPAKREIPVSVLLADMAPADIIGVVDAVGAPVSFTEASLPLSAEPVFIRTKLSTTLTGSKEKPLPQ